MTFRRVAIGLTIAMCLATFFLDLFSYVEVLWGTTWLFWVVGLVFFTLRFRYAKQEEWNLVTALEGSALLIIFTSLFGIATYLLPEHAQAMWDTELVGADMLLGIESRDVINHARQWPTLDLVLAKIYHALYIHLALLVVYAAGVRRDNERAWRFLTEMFVAAWLGLILYAFLPAYNAIDFYELKDTHHTLGIVEHLKAIRAGTFETLNFKDALGLVQFPSFHIAVQFVLLADIIRNEHKIVSAVFIVWTALMTWATVVVGAHYIVDLLGGGLIALVGALVGMLIIRSPSSGNERESTGTDGESEE